MERFQNKNGLVVKPELIDILRRDSDEDTSVDEDDVLISDIMLKAYKAAGSLERFGIFRR